MKLFRVLVFALLLCNSLFGFSVQKSIAPQIDAQLDSISKNPTAFIETFSDSSALSLAQLGAAYAELKQHYNSLEFLNKAIQFAKKQNDTLALTLAYQASYKPNHHETNYLQALENAFAYRAIALQLNDTLLLLKAMQQHGASLYYLNRRADCYAIQHQLFAIAQKIKNYDVMATAANNLIVQCADNDDIDSAIYWFNTGVKSHPSLPPIQLAKAYALLVPTLKTSTNYALRQQYADSALYYAYQSKDSTMIGFAHIKQAELYLQQLLHDSAVVHATKAVNIYTALKNTDGITHALSTIIVVNERENNPVKALEQYRYFFETYKTIYSISTAQQMAEFETKFKTAEKERENLLLKKDNAEKQLAIALAKKTRNNLIFGGIFILVLIGIAAFVVFYQNKIKQAQQVAELDKKRFKAMIEAQNEERVRIARELHDGVAQSLAGLKLSIEFEQLKQIKSAGINNPLHENWANKVTEVQQEVRAISHDLMPIKLTQLGFKKAVEALFENHLNAASITPTVTIHSEIKPNSPTDVALYRIIQELIANTIKHSQASKVTCSISQYNHQIKVHYCDNGKGLKKESNQGIGLINMKQRIESIGGSIAFKNLQEGNGLCVELLVNA